MTQKTLAPVVQVRPRPSSLGFDHERLTWRHAGRDYRLTDGHGNVVHGLLA